MIQSAICLCLFKQLNHSLYRTMAERTFVCFAMGELNLSTRTLRFSNGACPPPFHFRVSTGQVAELQIETYPLGIRPDTHYPVTETHLQPEDRLIFCSDGIFEAENASREQYGYDRTMETIRKGYEDNLSAEETLDRILKEVDAFRAAAHQTDEMSRMVLRVEDTA